MLGFVALLARAWIEIATKRIYMVRVYVALLARAWIEIGVFLSCLFVLIVALLARAWIEMVAPGLLLLWS